MREVVGGGPINFSEFGIFEGESIKYFADLNAHVNSRFVGFDTFEGLPEDWVEPGRRISRSTLNTDGAVPQTEDGRISFVKDLFQETFPGFLEKYQPGGQLIVHNDSDFFSATLYVLTRADNLLLPGTLIVCDEFYSVMHEFRALEDYCASYLRSYDVVAATERNLQVAIRMRWLWIASSAVKRVFLSW